MLRLPRRERAIYNSRGALARAFYLTIQLFMFREKLRVVEVMTKTMQGLSDGDLRNMADTIAKLPQPAGGPADPARMERARALIEKQHRCNFCHNRNYSGEQNVPRLAGRPWRKPELESAPF